MFCSFEGSPKIVRLHGRGEVIERSHDGFEELCMQFPDYEGLRCFIRIDCQRISDSCGWGVPLYEVKSQRSQLLAWADQKGADKVAQDQRDENSASLDGLPGVTLPAVDRDPRERASAVSP